MHERSFQRRRDASRPNATQRGYGWDWQKVSRQVRREEPVCHWCRREPSQVADHVIPVSRGGTSDRENLVGACFGCNRRRASRA
jgi:5-methylcytosine-specific restriction protein A